MSCILLISSASLICGHVAFEPMVATQNSLSWVSV